MTTTTTTSSPTTTDRLERQISIKAPRAKVWRALSNAEEFGDWFGADLKGQVFKPGERVQGSFTIKGHEGARLDIVIERVEPESLMSFRWHPYAVDPAVDYSKEERTLVTFHLEEAPGGTLLRVVESGFDKVPPARRMEAFRMNGNGWEWQLRRIDEHVTGA